MNLLQTYYKQCIVRLASILVGLSNSCTSVLYLRSVVIAG